MQLPINEKKQEIISLLKKEQVVIISGETGSGKTTQLPQICLEMGLAEKGKIALTQPRRIAATSISARIAKETKTQLGGLVGYKIRFDEKLSKSTKILCQTDGILLQELSHNPNLFGYSVIIIDEAHERSLNIDFLLGYLRKTLKKRKDLKLIISSATMDTGLFSAAFDNAPVVNVSGRMYPVEIIYDEDVNAKNEGDYIDRTVKAVENLVEITDDGDILLFMPTERDILETAKKLRGRFSGRNFDILPLFSRLTNAEQNRIFDEKDNRKIIVSTNIAETSITIPRIKFVVDTGLVRIAKYAPNLRTNRLPIEEASKAEAKQRAGRCGRVSDGVCVRLYSKKNFEGRDEFRLPEIQRLNLASVVLQMLHLNLGEIKDFPFIEPPENRRIDDAVNQLSEFGAVKTENNILRLTEIGKKMAKFPLEPHISRMLIQAQKEGVSEAVAIIAAGLSIVDVRERPQENADAANNAHKKFEDIYSDFITLLKMWSVFHNSFDKQKTQRAMRNYCAENFLSFNRMREWCDIYEQISGVCKEIDINFAKTKIDFENLTETQRWAIHKSICAGLIGNIAVYDNEKQVYLATKNRVAYIFPGSSLAGGKKRKAQWIMAQQIMETSRVFARTLGPIDPKWIVEFAPNLLKKRYDTPYYNTQAGSVVAHETLSFYGLEVSSGVKRFWGNINAKEAREIFIQTALVEGEMRAKFPFFEKNFALIEKLKEIEIQRRIVGQLFSREEIFNFYDRKIPQNISSDNQILGWLKKNEKCEVRSEKCKDNFTQNVKSIDEFLTIKEADLISPIFANLESEYPDFLGLGNTKFPLSYRCNFGQEDDGITAEIPENELLFINDNIFDWLIQPLLQLKIEELLRTLPKEERKKFLPIEENAKKIFSELKFDAVKNKTFYPPQISLSDAINSVIKKSYNFSDENIPSFLKLRIAVVGKDKKIIGYTKNLRNDKSSLLKNVEANNTKGKLGNLLGQKTIKNYEKIVENYDEFIKNIDLNSQIIKQNIKDDFGYPALVAEKNCVNIVWFGSPDLAAKNNPFGLAKLLEFSLTEDFGWLEKNLRFMQNKKILATGFGGTEIVSKRLFEIIRSEVCFPVTNVKTWREFDEMRKIRQGVLRNAEKTVLSTFEKIVKAIAKTREYLSAQILKSPKNKFLKNIENDLEVYIDQLKNGFCPLEIFNRYPFYIEALICKIDKALNSPKHYDECEKITLFYYNKSVELVEKIHKNSPEFEEFVKKFCYLCEELTIKLFAEPKIKSIENISQKKLDKFLEENEK